MASNGVSGMGTMDEGILQEFLAECHENLGHVEGDLVALERDPGDPARIASVFRAFHTIKGTCGFFGFTKLAAVTHAGENLLSLLRAGDRPLTSPMADALLALVDAVREILAAIEATREEGGGDYAALIDRLNRLQAEAEAEASAPGRATAAGAPAAPESNGGAGAPATQAPAAPAAPSRPPDTVVTPADGGLFGPLIESGRLNEEAVALAAQQQRLGDPRRLGEILVDHGALQPQDILDALLARSEAAASALADSSIRVDVHLLDLLMNLVGELVLARNQLLLKVASQNHADLPGTVQRLNHITTELQERIMKTRMQPVGNLYNKLPRLVRDVAAACGKQVRLDVEGAETELDRTIIEAIRDPMTHLIRNAVDHGIETPDVRTSHGKPAEGRLAVRAFHEGGKVHLEVSDDGGGLPLAAIREKALERNLVPADRIARMTDRDWANVIFLPGFSTAPRVTNVSGRGVGMDVVKTNVERIGGTIDVESKPGEGTTVRVRIPLTLAIVPALIVESGGERYAIPQVNLIELLRVERAEAATRIATAYDAPVLRYRDRLLPLLDLRDLLGIPARSAATGTRAGAKGAGMGALGGDEGAISIAVLHADGVSVGLVVDAIDASQEIVVKPLGEPLRQIPVFAGATILGDGTVALILDVPGLARHADVTQRALDAAPSAPRETEEAGPSVTRTLVVCRAGQRWTVAVPQGQIARLEEFHRSGVERIGDRAVIQYRGGILPLVSLGALLDLGGAPEAADIEWIGNADPLRVVVHERGGRAIGLVVESILEIVEERVAAPRAAAGPGSASAGAGSGAATGFAGATVVRGAVTELLDLEGLVTSADVERLAAVAAPAGGGAR
ncbi:MAG TPA: chemotaxis protein CheW [Candidatus Eisenbacteria bacterium]|nr:chemotaxis protein CheW [Candidatus Eisenbacteria bacterium]